MGRNRKVNVKDQPRDFREQHVIKFAQDRVDFDATTQAEFVTTRELHMDYLIWCARRYPTYRSLGAWHFAYELTEHLKWEKVRGPRGTLWRGKRLRPWQSELEFERAVDRLTELIGYVDRTQTLELLEKFTEAGLDVRAQARTHEVGSSSATLDQWRDEDAAVNPSWTTHDAGSPEHPSPGAAGSEREDEKSAAGWPDEVHGMPV